MDDSRIIELFLERSETAISESKKKYGAYCRYIASRILGDEKYAEEVENDVYLYAWDSIPPFVPENLRAYLGMLARRTAMNRSDAENAEKRLGNVYGETLDELSDMLSGQTGNGEPDGDGFSDGVALRDSLDRFVGGLKGINQCVFVRRYWYMSGISEIAGLYGLSENNVRTILSRTRKKLAEHLRKEGFFI